MKPFNYQGRDQEKNQLITQTICPVLFPYLCYLSMVTTWAKPQALDCSSVPVRTSHTTNGCEHGNQLNWSFSAPGLLLSYAHLTASWDYLDVSHCYLYGPGSASGFYSFSFSAIILDPLISHLSYFFLHLHARSFWNTSHYAASLNKNVR